MIDCKEEEVPAQLMKFYTKECFLYQDVNAILRLANRLSEETEIAAKFKDLVSYYFMLL